MLHEVILPWFSTLIANFRLLKMRDSSHCGKASLPTTSVSALTPSSPSYSLSRSPMLYLVYCFQIGPYLVTLGFLVFLPKIMKDLVFKAYRSLKVFGAVLNIQCPNIHQHSQLNHQHLFENVHE